MCHSLRTMLEHKFTIATQIGMTLGVENMAHLEPLLYIIENFNQLISFHGLSLVSGQCVFFFE